MLKKEWTIIGERAIIFLLHTQSVTQRDVTKELNVDDVYYKIGKRAYRTLF